MKHLFAFAILALMLGGCTADPVAVRSSPHAHRHHPGYERGYEKGYREGRRDGRWDKARHRRHHCPPGHRKKGRCY